MQCENYKILGETDISSSEITQLYFILFYDIILLRAFVTSVEPYRYETTSACGAEYKIKRNTENCC